jgi:hypothetical protein
VSAACPPLYVGGYERQLNRPGSVLARLAATAVADHSDAPVGEMAPLTDLTVVPPRAMHKEE